MRRGAPAVINKAILANTIFAAFNWIAVVLGIMSVLLFSCPDVTFFQFAMGVISINNFMKQLNVNDMKNNIIRWVRASMGIQKKLITD
ncbi:hypothetical protein SY85_11835 [Flavisolibacter tropicus]|uniref:Uncharacterized protein n=1 Tax=Flavisolibacter tropicus TaxID=1492898 RepID=A0A172TVI3_9BACT|nr:hypothetical protein SY85_11835 [Flavisolibacter tropicus]